MEFQAVIMAGGRGTRMGCITEGTAKALIPVGQHPLLYYPAKLLEKWGFEEAILIVPSSQSGQFSTAIGQMGLSLKFDIVQINDDDDLGTAEALRIVAPKIKRDVLVLSGDLISDIALQVFADKHRRQNAAATILMADESLAFADMDETKLKGNQGAELIVALDKDDNDRVCVFVDEGDVEGGDLPMSRRMLENHPQLMFCKDLYDGHLYLLKKWVVDYVAANPTLKSLQCDLLPKLISSQFKRRSPKAEAASSGYATPSLHSSLDESEPRGLMASSLPPTDIRRFVPQDHWFDSCKAGASIPGTREAEELYGCYAYIMEAGHCVRANTMQLYAEICRTFSHSKLSSLACENIPNVHPSVSKKEKSQACSESVIDAKCTIGERCSIKKSTISKHCTIGDRVRITNSIIMDHVTIKDGCTLHNTIVCSNAYINEQCSLTNCQVGEKCTVNAKTHSKNEELNNDSHEF